MRIHYPKMEGTVGTIDSWGFGSWSRVVRWPTLPGSPVHAWTGSTGGVSYPPIAGAVRQDNMLPYSPDQVWGGGGVCFVLADGTEFRPILVDGVPRGRAFEEISPVA